MKKFFSIVIIILAVLLLPVFAFCQDVAEAIPALPGFDMAEHFISLAAISAIVMPVTQWLKKIMGSSGIGTKLLSWIVATALSFTSWYFGLGVLANVAWYWVLLYAFAAGLVANSIVDNEIIQAILNLIKTKENG